MNSPADDLSRSKTVMIVAGEASGDHHGAHLVRVMRQKSDRIRFVGIGGHALRREGVEIVVDAATLSVVGITEVFVKIRSIFRGMARAKRLLRTRCPALLVLIDFPDFNLHLAAYARRLGVPVLYYISPQVWAWRSGRVRTIRKRVNRMAVILPFEHQFYQKHSVPVTFVGHPLLDRRPRPVSPDFEERFEAAPVVGLLPGSRDGEVRKLLPVMLETAEHLHRWFRQIRFLVSRSASVDAGLVSGILRQHQGNARLEMVPDNPDRIFAESSFIIAASGTVTLETAIAGIPMVIIYKVSPVSYRLGKALIRVPHISLVNLILEREVVPELIQDDASPARIAGAVTEMLEKPDELKRISRELLTVRDLLGGAGASGRVADIALKMMDDH